VAHASEEQHDSIITIRTTHGGVLVDGKETPFHPTWGELYAAIPGTESVLFPSAELSWPGMCAHLMNSVTNTGRAPNVQVTDPDGVVVAASDIPLWDDTKNFRGNIRSELLWDYHLKAPGGKR
jgi:hypothetical protein